MTALEAALIKALGLSKSQLIGVVNANESRKVAKQPKRTKAEVLADKDRSILATFRRRGFKDTVLMDRTDRNKPFNVRPFGRIQEDGSKTGWLGEGRVVKKGETSVRGLFHVDQTEELPKAAE